MALYHQLQVGPPYNSPMDLDVHLSSWIIGDGNYRTFYVGETREFALEFYSSAPLPPLQTHMKSLQPRNAYRYDISAEVVFAAGDACVIDCGVLAYTQSIGTVSDGIACGDFIGGEGIFGVDLFFYFERLRQVPGMPPLIFDWHINSIDQETTPLTLSKVCDRLTYIRDEAQRSFGAVLGTDETLTQFPDICPEYVLRCTRLEEPPRHQRRSVSC
jgi:hypothetical protein